jgi:ABC-type lipoprotein release transport system permease subunit
MSTGPLLRLRLAARNLIRERRRTLLSGLAMVIGMALLVFSRALAEGGHEEWIEAGVRLGNGHVSVQYPEYGRRRTIDRRLAPATVDAVERAIASPGIERRLVAAAPRLSVQGLASSASSALPVAVTGVDPEAERHFSLIPEKLDDGRYLETDDRLRAFVGARLAERLDLDVGDRFVLTAQDASGEIVGQMARVAGTFRTGIPEADESIVQIPLSTAREWLDVPGAVTSYDLLLRGSRDVRAVRSALRSQLADLGDAAEVLTWRDAQPDLAAAVRMDDFADYVFHAILFGIAALAIINTILMSVMRRTREFGVLRALGLRRSEVGRIVFVEGLLLTLASGVTGMVLGLAGTWLLFRNGFDFSSFMNEDLTAAGVVIDPVVIPAFRITQVLASLAFIFAIGSLASLYPAWRATRVDVAEAMKFAE